MTTLGLRDLGFVAAGQQAASDPNFSSVSLLLHGDGANGSTTIIDSSSSPKTVTAFDNAQISTAQSKFGGASLAFDGNGDYLTSPVSSDFEFATGDFTVETFIYLNSLSPFCIIILGEGAIGGGNPVQCGWAMRWDSNQLYFYRYAHPTETQYSFNWTPSLNTWYHLAVSRNNSSLRAFVDGTQIGTTQNASTSYNRVNQDNLQIGRKRTGLGTLFFNGYIDELRITKGVARYTSNFTPPTAPFPDF